MLKRRAIAGLGGAVLAGFLLAAPAAAQVDDEVSPPVVAETTLVPETTTTVQVAGVVQQQPLPRTGGEFGPEVLAGIALTGSGIALAVGARRRRSRVSA